ncbi:MAG: CaiB/BaiF CoA-transferase family protein, partial [Pseudomonadota bacterium]
KTEAGREVFLRLVAGAQVVVENFRPGVMDRLRLGFETLKEVNPQLIYCAISGFGQDGPLRDLPAYDQIIQGMSGTMSITGDPDTAPYRVGYPVCDTIGGLTAAMAVSAALAGGPERPATFIDVSMLEATLATMGWVVSNWLVAGQAPAPHGNENVTSAPSGLFQAADGALNIAANKQEQWEILCRHLGRVDLLDHPDYKTRERRKEHRTQLKAALEQTLRSRPAAAWAEELAALGVPAGPVLTVPEVLDHPQIAERGMVADFPHPTKPDAQLRLLRPGLKINGEAPAVERPPPALGQDSDAILEELGYDAADIAALKGAGAF